MQNLDKILSTLTLVLLIMIYINTGTAEYYYVNTGAAELFVSYIHRLKQKLTTQFSASNDEKYFNI